MLTRSRGVSENLAGAVRVTPVHSAANFAYHNSPVIGDRFLAVGDAVAFVDPIFSGGVYIALRTGQLAADAIAAAFAAGDFRRRRFVPYERRVRRGLGPLFKFIHKYYEPSFFHLLMRPRSTFGVYAAVLNVLSGGNWIRMPWRVRASLQLLFVLARVKAWTRRRQGLPVESRLEW
jgi:flavin-dependent dehydrogenase